MTLVAFNDLMADAARHNYAVGYFESFSHESLLAVADAAEATGSPVILGFSGIYLPHPDRREQDRLASYTAMGLAVCRELSVPACLLFNESPDATWVSDAIEQGFGLVMYSDDEEDEESIHDTISRLVSQAHARGAAVEAELAGLPGVRGDLEVGSAPDLRMTDPVDARRFVERTGIDALAVNIGQVHVHGRQAIRLDLEALRALVDLPVPLVLHGGTSVEPADLQAAIKIGIRKINVGSRLKQTYLAALQDACRRVRENDNPYEVIGSGLDGDVLLEGRRAMRRDVEKFMHLFGSAGRARDWRPA